MSGFDVTLQRRLVEEEHAAVDLPAALRLGEIVFDLHVTQQLHRLCVRHTTARRRAKQLVQRLRRSIPRLRKKKKKHTQVLRYRFMFLLDVRS